MENVENIRDFMNEFQERLQDLINDKKISKNQLADLVGVNHDTLNNYFRKNFYPDILVAKRLASYFDCSLDYLFGLSDNVKNVDKNNKTFFENFNSLLNNFDVSLYKVMHDLKMSYYNYYRWKDGVYPRTSRIIDIAKYFNVSVDYLVGCGK